MKGGLKGISGLPCQAEAQAGGEAGAWAEGATRDIHAALSLGGIWAAGLVWTLSGIGAPFASFQGVTSRPNHIFLMPLYLYFQLPFHRQLKLRDRAMTAMKIKDSMVDS